ncbi:MAG TPA: 5-(carboxyamino)imidazole ribonucleotide mutase [Victivallales bacterium]|nr:5-(carboxyamino)imidazole ribonucleotide mutase [Victivallales bacterium]
MEDSKATVAVIMGSDSDLPNLKGAFSILNDLSIPYTARVISAHRTPAVALDFAQNAEKNGLKILICAAGMAAHLAGVMASHTTLPVIGIPMPCEPFNGFDSLLSTVQMPPGIPVATVTAGKAGAKNAALYAAQILSLSDKELSEKLKTFRAEQTAKVKKADSSINNRIKELNV